MKENLTLLYSIQAPSLDFVFRHRWRRFFIANVSHDMCTSDLSIDVRVHLPRKQRMSITRTPVGSTDHAMETTSRCASRRYNSGLQHDVQFRIAHGEDVSRLLHQIIACLACRQIEVEL